MKLDYVLGLRIEDFLVTSDIQVLNAGVRGRVTPARLPLIPTAYDEKLRIIASGDGFPGPPNFTTSATIA